MKKRITNQVQHLNLPVVIRSNMHAHCPICKQKTNIDARNKTRPFCSTQCEMKDLGIWASEQYSIVDTSDVCSTLENDYTDILDIDEDPVN